MRLETQALAEQYRDRLFATAFQVCGNAADAEDARFLRIRQNQKN